MCFTTCPPSKLAFDVPHMVCGVVVMVAAAVVVVVVGVCVCACVCVCAATTSATRMQGPNRKVSIVVEKPGELQCYQSSSTVE